MVQSRQICLLPRIKRDKSWAALLSTFHNIDISLNLECFSCDTLTVFGDSPLLINPVVSVTAGQGEPMQI